MLLLTNLIDVGIINFTTVGDLTVDSRNDVIDIHVVGA